MDLDMQSELSCNSEQEHNFHGVTLVRSRYAAVAMLLSLAVCGLAFVASIKDQSGGRSDTTATSMEDIVSLAKDQTDHKTGPCTAAYGPLLKIEHIIDARDLRLKENMPKSELDTSIAIRDKKYSPELLEAIEEVLDNATWEDYLAAEAVITTEDMQAIARCLLGDSDVDLSEEEAPKVLSIQGANSQAGRAWPNGQVRYAYHSSCGQTCRRAFNAAILEIQQQVPCVRFSNSNSGDYILVRADKGGCYSSVGYRGRGAQELNLARGCQITGIAIHEAFHALGIHHEQTRSDRDKYVRIQWQNMRGGVEHNFKKSDGTYTGSSYDFLSIMHYGATAFSTNGQQTIAPTVTEAARYMGQRMHASQYDMEQVCKFYGCASTCSPKVKNKDLIDELVGGSSAPVTKQGCTCVANWQRRGFNKCTNPRNKGCCNPDQDGKGAWCFTTTRCIGRSYDYCNPPKTAPQIHEGCRCKNGWAYNGKQSSASTGHCFNPNNHAGGTWCFIDRSACARGRHSSWDYCEPK